MTPTWPPGRGLPTVLVRSTFAGSKFGQKIGQKIGLFNFRVSTSGYNFRDISETLTNLTDMVWEISEDGDLETFRLF